MSEARILLEYALKPAIIPTLAVLGMGFGELLGGAVFAEVVFNRPGLGSLIYDAIRTRNYPVVQGGCLRDRAPLRADQPCGRIRPDVSRSEGTRSAPGGGSMTGRAIAREVMRRPGGGFGLVVVLVAILFAAAAAPSVAPPHAPNAIAPANRFASPDLAHLFGTDHLGRDLLSRLIFGTRVALGVALSVIALSLTAGVALDVKAALSPRPVDLVIFGVFDVVTSFLSMVLALALIAVFGPGLGNVVLLVSVVFIPHFGRLARAQTIALRNSPFIEAEKVLGAQGWRIVLHHVAPNIIGPIFALACMDVSVVITIEACLSFLGLGFRPPLASWGNLLNDGYVYLDQSIWPAVFSGIALILATLGFSLLGEALRDTLDPRLRTGL